MATTATDVQAMLRRHYLPEGRPQSGVLVTEVKSPCGRRQADAIWAPLTIGGGNVLVGHEIKVTRSDVLAELADLTKADPWAQYCTYWWLTVSDPALVDGLDIPEAWGVMAPPSGRRTRTMTVLRKAPKLTPMEPATAWRRILAKVHYGTHASIAGQEQSARYADQQIERLREEIRTLRTQGAYATPEAKTVSAVLHALCEQAQGRSWHRPELDPATIATALLDADTLTRANDAARRNLEQLATSISRIIDDARSPLGLTATRILAELDKEVSA